jgi:predicted nucleotidyltransferase
MSYREKEGKNGRKGLLMNSQEQVKLITEKIKEKYYNLLNKIFLFGSYAYGSPNKDSDLDICVIMDYRDTRKIDIMREIRRKLGSSYDFPLDILIYNEKEFDERSKFSNSLERKIQNDGVVLYAKQ